jgi:serine/threonine protein kinase
MAAEDVFGIVGSVVAGAYRVQEVVAEGGFGVVYRAYHSGFRAPVALKCLKIPHQFSEAHQAEFLEQFRAEAELLFRLSSSIPTVVRPLTIDAVSSPKAGFMPFLALEWLEGETLEAIAEKYRAAQRPLDLRTLVALLTPVARALEKAHKFVGPKGPISIVHRDMKPENIFVAQVAGEQVVKILDFGIGKAKSVASQVAGRASQSPSAASSFTPAYGAPEQWLPNRYGQTGPWTDVWGLALTLVETLTGRHVMDGDHAAMMGRAIDPTSRPTPRSEGMTVADSVEVVFAKALAVDPRQRYADAGAFWNALVQAIEQPDPVGAEAAGPDGAAFIPDLDVGPAAAPKLQKSEEQMSVMDMDAFGVEGEPVQLDLDLEEGEALRARPEGPTSADGAPATGQIPRGAAEAAEQSGLAGQTDAAAIREQGDEPEPEVPTQRSLTELYERAAEYAREMWADDAPLGLRLAPGTALVVVALAITGCDQIYAAVSDEVISLGPIRAGWIAGPLLLGGIGLIVYRLIPRD